MKKVLPSMHTTVCLSLPVVVAIDELAGFIGPTRTRAMKFYLITALVASNCIDTKPFTEVETELKQPNEYPSVGEGPLVPVSLRIHTRLWDVVEEASRHMKLGRSEFIRLILNRAVDDNIGRRHPSLKQTLANLGLERNLWPWEKAIVGAR